jgi:hypothetical protein
MKRIERLAVVGFAMALVAAAACSTTETAPTSTGTGASLLIVNGASVAGAVRVYVDGQAQASTVGPGQASSALSVSPGSHTVELRSTTGTTGFVRTVQFAQGNSVIVVAMDSVGLVTPSVLSDTGALVPAGATKLRVAHMASNAPNVDIWRTQPDYATPIRVQFPFAYGVTSPYLQSTPGSWRVMVSHIVTSGAPLPTMPDTLANTGLITIADGSSKTIVIVNAAGGGIATVVVDR